MCGICGIVSGEGEGKIKPALQRMNNAIAHRGPDAEGTWHHKKTYLGHRRLSIIDLSDAGKQPMFSYDKRYVIVYNGELYNFRELRLQLQRAVQGTREQPYFFSTQTDTEVVLAAYMRWGKDCLHYFNGMFAFAIHDTQEDTLFIARDRLGIKPLYYSYQDNTLLFSSEVRSIAHSGLVEKKINRDVLPDYLMYQTVHAPNTIWQDIKMLLPGHFIWLQNNEMNIGSWWKPEQMVNFESRGKSYENICQDVKNLFFAAVERRLVADVPFGAFLSGGIDSSAVVAAMSQVSRQKVKTFSVVFDEKEFSEAVFARQVAEKYGTEHHEIKLTPLDFLEQVPDALNAMDHPGGDGPNTYVVSKATRKAGITMALSGLGGDELFCGYDIFTRSFSIEKKWWLNLIPRLFRLPAGLAIRNLNKNIASWKIAEVLASPQINFQYSYPVSRQLFSAAQVRKMLQRENLPMNEVYRFLRLLDFNEKGHRLSKYSIAEMSTYMQNTLLRDTDQMSMAVALEVRVPFLDYKLVEYVLGVEDRHKFPAKPKKLLVDAMGGLLPTEVVHRKKMGFVLPWQFWMKNELKDLCMDNLAHLEEIGINKFEINNLWSGFEKNDPRVSWSRLWPLVTLGNYINKN